MKEKITATMAYIKRQIEWQEEELEADRAQVIRAAENSDAETIISWANTMKRTENRLHELKLQLSMMEHLLKD